MRKLLITSISPSLTHGSCQPLQITVGIKSRTRCPHLLLSLLFGSLPPLNIVYSRKMSFFVLDNPPLLCLLSCLSLVQCLPEVGRYSLCSEDSFRLSGTHLSIPLSSPFHCSVYLSHCVYLPSPLLAANQSNPLGLLGFIWAT